MLLAHLQSRLKKLEAHYLFREREAEAHYHSAKSLADQQALENRLSGSSYETSAPPIIVSAVPSALSVDKKLHRPPNLKPANQQTELVIADVFDQDSSSEEDGGLFGILLDPMPESEITTNGTQVHIRDMALPKHWAGRTPKSLLSEMVQRADRYAVISYRILPDTRTSRAKRAGVTVRWEGAKTGEWFMDDVGCWDEAQAEQYISTVALHDVTFGHSEGFAGGGVSGGGGQTYFRLLPPVFRDLWDELELKRKQAEDSRNRKVWGTLQKIVESKSGGDRKV